MSLYIYVHNLKTWRIKNVLHWKKNYLFISYNTIINYILIIYELSNCDHVVGIVSQNRVSDGSRTQDFHTNSLALYPIDYSKGHPEISFCFVVVLQIINYNLLLNIILSMKKKPPNKNIFFYNLMALLVIPSAWIPITCSDKISPSSWAANQMCDQQRFWKI